MAKRKQAKSPATGASALPPASAAAAVNRTGVNWKWFAILTVIVGAVPFLLYANTFTYGSIFNDVTTMQRTVLGENSTPFDLFLRPFIQPYVRASFESDLQHYRLDFGWYHLVNVWVHLSSAVALFMLTFVLARRLRPVDSQNSAAPYSVAAMAGLIYGCHPLAAQSASYISARWASLGASNFLFALLFFVFFLTTRGAIRVWSAIITVAYSLMCLGSSEVALVLAPSMVALFYMLKPTKLTWKDWALDHPVTSVITSLLSVSVPFYLLVGFGQAATPNSYGMPQLSDTAYMATTAKAFLTYYTRAFFAPLGLSIDPPFAQATGFSDLLTIGGLVLFAGCLYLLYRYRSQPLFFFGMWLLVLGYLPHAVLVQPDAVADPAFYLSLAGLSLVCAWLIFEIFRGPIRQEAPKVVAIIVGLGALAVVHNLDFRNNDSLIASTLMTNHRSVLATTMAAQEKINKKDYPGAIKDADEAISIDPSSAMGYYIRGMAQLRAHEESEAKHSFEKASQLSIAQRLPLLADVKYGLAESYVAMDKVDTAAEVAAEGFKKDPHSGRASYITGLIALKRRDYPTAMSYLGRAMQLGVTEARLPGARVLLGMKQYDEAASMAGRIAADNDDPEGQLIMGNAALALGDLNMAETSLKNALRANPHNAEVMALLSILYERKGDKAVAESYHNDAIQRDAQIFSKLLLPEPKKK